MEYKRNRNYVDLSVLYKEAAELLSENGEISASLIQRKLFVGYAKAREIIDLLEKEGVIQIKNYKGLPVDKIGETSVKVSSGIYNVSNSWNHLFVCGTDSDRTEIVSSVMNQLKGKAVDSLLLSVDPSNYSRIADAKNFSTLRVNKILKQMDARYDMIADSMSRNYIDYNSKSSGSEIPLFVLVIDGVDQVLTNTKYKNFIKALHCLSMKCRASGIHVLMFVGDDGDIEGNALYQQFPNPIKVKKA